MQSLKVPCWPGVRPWLRGTHSYHAPARARGRSATSGNKLRSRQVGAATGSRPWPPSTRRQQWRGLAGLQKNPSHCLKMIAAAAWPPSWGLGEHARAFDRVEGEVDAGSLLEFESAAASREFIGPGLDRIDMASGARPARTIRPAVVAVMGPSLAAPFPLRFTAPDQDAATTYRALAIDIGPNLDAFANDPLDRESGRRRSADRHLQYGKAPAARSRQFELFCSR